MLLRRDGDEVVAIGQPAHAWVSGQLARAWGNERFGAVDPYEDVCLAAEQHDAGMAAWEVRPTLNEQTGLPRSFMELTLDEHLEIWWSAAPLVAPQSAYAALLVSMHGTALYERRDLARLAAADADRVRRSSPASASCRSGCSPRSGRRRPAHGAPQPALVWTWDSLSLALLLDWPPFELEGVPTADGEVITVRVARAVRARSTRGRSPPRR